MKRSHIFLGCLICLMFAGAITALFAFEPAPGARESLLIMVGALGAAFGQVVSYWFGSSAGPARKDELLAKEQQ